MKLGTSCVVVSPQLQVPGLLFAARERRKLIKARGWGEGLRHLGALVVLHQDTCPQLPEQNSYRQ